MTTTKQISAAWDADQMMYVSLDRDCPWWSTDGETWYDDYHSSPVEGEDFESTEIRLIGGPRGGEVVA